MVLDDVVNVQVTVFAMIVDAQEMEFVNFDEFIVIVQHDVVVPSTWVSIWAETILVDELERIATSETSTD